MVEDIPGSEIKLAEVTKCFATLFEGQMSQEIDLLAEGYTAGQLDSQPVVAVEDWFSGSGFIGSYYQITVLLLNENKEVIETYQPPQQTLDPDQSPWTQVFHEFSDYGSGLHFVSFEHGGGLRLQGNNSLGVRVTASSVKLFHPLKNPLNPCLKVKEESL